MKLISTNPELASIRRRGDKAEELTPDESYRYEAFTRGLFRYWEDVHYQFRTELYAAEEFNKQREAWRAHAPGAPGAVRWWCAHRTEFSDQFAEDYSTLLPGTGCT